MERMQTAVSKGALGASEWQEGKLQPNWASFLPLIITTVPVVFDPIIGRYIGAPDWEFSYDPSIYLLMSSDLGWL